MVFVGLDVGTGGVRAAALDGRMELVARAALPLRPGRRSSDGGHLLDEAHLIGTAVATLDAVCAGHRLDAAAVAVSGAAGTLCFRDAAGESVASAVAYDDARHGTGLGRVDGWARALPDAVRVIPLADAVLEALGADPCGTDWNNALKLGWDPGSLEWPSPQQLRAGFVPAPVAPGTVAGRAREPAPFRGALLVRGTTDGCAMQLASGVLRPSDWSVSLGTTLVWKSVLAAGASSAPAPLPAGAYAHRLRGDLWLPGAASNSGGGVLAALEARTDLRRRDLKSRFPSGFSAYPLARPGERFPVADAGFAGFGLPGAGDPRRHAAILEGVAFVMRLGVERLVGAGVAEPTRVRITGGGARSSTWMRVVAAVLGREVIAAPHLDPALGAALLAASAALGAPAGTIEPGPTARGAQSTHEPERDLCSRMADAYEAFASRIDAHSSASPG